MIKANKDSLSDDSNEFPRRVKLYFSGEADTPAERMAAIRQLRKGQILNYLLHDGPASRVDVSRALGFNLRTVSLLVAALIEDNIIVEKAVKASKNMGRRPVPLELNSHAACVLAIDVRRHRTVMALLDLHGHILVRSELASDFGDSPEDQSGWIVTAVENFLRKHHGNLPPLAGAGLSIEGFVFKQHTAQKHSSTSEPISAALEEWLQVPVSSDTDSRLVAVAEQWFGGAKGTRNAAIFNIGDGFGIGCLTDGRLLTGSSGLAGEIGHVPLGEPSIPCYCESNGCLENIVSGSGLARLAVKAGLYKNIENVDIAELTSRFRKEAKVKKIMENFSRHLALAVILADNLFDPEVIVISGPVAPYLAPFKDLIMKEVEKSAVPFIMEKSRIAFSNLGEDTVLLGAAGQILNHIYSASHVAAETLL